eukprot:TRINITY_DN2818_c0_g1_i3.p1 TRINITY_DN2818_c0_g1~~TRINITY_DN2818_c0_g1_i3.p1  ORF type:complete len:142 (-),score=19.03 TRINITY_DN2818_c0_g1_i3:51-476(-)
MVHILDVEMAKLLSLVSRFISNTMKRFIEDHFYFSVETKRRFAHYQPKYIQGVLYHSQINPSIQRVKFNYYFNECIDLSEFTHLTHIEYGICFNHPIESRLPVNLIHLSFCGNFNQRIDGFLPKKLTYLELGYNFQPSSSL